MLSNMFINSSILRFSLKTGITCSAVYWTIESGVWKDSETTTELYHKMKKEMKPYVKPLVEFVPFDVPEMPKAGDVCSTGKTMWNKGVMQSCLFLSNFCDKAWDYSVDGVKYSYEKLREQLDKLEETKT